MYAGVLIVPSERHINMYNETKSKPTMTRRRQSTTAKRLASNLIRQMNDVRKYTVFLVTITFRRGSWINLLESDRETISEKCKGVHSHIRKETAIFYRKLNKSLNPRSMKKGRRTNFALHRGN